jgi:hypothetical protein
MIFVYYFKFKLENTQEQPMKLIEACELVFVAEGVLNVVSGTLLTFFPAFVMAQQGLPATVPPTFF